MRLDVWLVDRGLAASREKAQALVMAGRVRVNGAPAKKAGSPVREDAAVEVLPGPEHVGRGAVKLSGALDVLGVDPGGKVAVDVGASTGGFTEVLLARGAARVYAVDVGRGQIHEKIRADPRVIVLERTNARHLSPRAVPEPCGVATLDVSFISVRKVLPALRSVLAPAADVVALVKPQFELGRGEVGRGGIVRDPERHLQALREVAAAALSEGTYVVAGACPSPIAGMEGNREFFLHLRPGGGGLAALAPAALDAVLEKAVRG
ncbi:MAG TPA: TlyA family RNA methyltransferase [Vicinamibacteria bacterium]|nr:TlyA family RNA methyltransferase [Vicinamibacteria bacterium]